MWPLVTRTHAHLVSQTMPHSRFPLQAYKKWAEKNEEQVTVPYVNLTHDQLFFLNFGQIWCENNRPEAMLTKIRSGQHSPNKFRWEGSTLCLFINSLSLYIYLYVVYLPFSRKSDILKSFSCSHRVIGTLSNSEDFSRAYNCPVGSRMNPERKCKVW